jgi:hypothetical protein
VADSQDIVEINGQRLNAGQAARPAQSPGSSRFLSIWFRCCNAYGRIYKDAAETHYSGRCPKCGASVKARIGANGTSRRTFEAR